ncbi:MAG: hypothetical protein ABIS36_26025 [Chryseolinea sp.]
MYDPSTQLLLTGDTFYPGRLYIRDWSSFKQSIDRLVVFSKSNEVKYILGNHIEMSTTDGIDYPVGVTYQPEEQKLPLNTDDLQTLQSALSKLGERPARAVLDKFIISPK